MANDEAEKTEPATPKRREDSRRKGQVAQSRELQSVALLTMATIVFGSDLAVRLLKQTANLSVTLWTTARPQQVGDFHAAILHAMMIVAAPMIAMILLFSLAGAGAALVQTGPMFSFEVLKPRGERISPLKGMKRLVDMDRLFDLGKALFKVGIVGTITWVVVRDSLERVIGLSNESLSASLHEAGRMAWDVAVGSLLFLAAMAAIDVVYQRWRFEKRSRMSKKEVRDELKDREGNPQLRARARALQREMSPSRMLAEVADASVVVTNPTHFAVALKYTGVDGAPRVVAKGRNHVAFRIREVARKNGIPVVENRPLARLLHRKAAVGQEIPEALYQAVAEVLAYVYRLDPSRVKARSAAR